MRDIRKLPWAPTWRFVLVGMCAWLAAVWMVPSHAQTSVYQYDRAGNSATFYTISEDEARFIDKTLADAYAKQGVSFAAWPTQQAGTVPIYRFYNPVTRAHFYTASEAERRGLLDTPAGKGWLPEGIAFYAYLEPGPDRVQIGRLWDSNNSIHRYLVDPRFELALFAAGIFPEGTAFYAIRTTPSTAAKRGNDAARLLTQATFGVRNADEVRAVENASARGWLNQQFALPYQSSGVQYLRDIEASGVRIEEQHPYEAVWQHMLFGEDQLRARVSFALSQLMVISNVAPDQNNWALVSWWDMLATNAFGNYRQLLEAVTLHPTMGYYLNMMGNAKEDPATGRNPNENYAREVLQLFSIGLNQLNLDGSLKRDAAGAPIPTFNQAAVEGFAKVFTGWSHGGNDTASSDGFNSPKENWLQPMQAWSSQHSTVSKTLLNGASLPAGQTAEKDLRDALDTIANHPNVAPFISKRLIQALVTSNPSPGYIARVATVFNNNGQGTRGDMRAVIEAILLDQEARAPAAADAAKYGKMREPVMRYTQLLRATNARAGNGKNSVWWLDSADDGLGQSPLLAPSVFNFFSPLYTKAGPIAKAGLLAPEFQIATEAQVVGSTNYLQNIVFSEETGFRDEGKLKLNFGSYASLANDPRALVDALALVLTCGQLSDAARSVIVDAVSKQSADNANMRVKTALVLMLVTPDFVIQR